MSVALLLEPDRPHSLGDLADAADASIAMASRVVSALRQRRLVRGEVVHGKRATVVATPRLFEETAKHWPKPMTWVLGGTVSPAHPVGGGPALRARGLRSDDHPVVYVRQRADIAGVLADMGGALVTEPVAQWGLAVLDLALPAGPVPGVVAALELASHPRGREQLGRHWDQLIPSLPRQAR